MIILALDTASKAASCAVLKDNVLVGEYFLNVGITHSETILAMVEELCHRSRVPLGSIDLLAVSHGPGSYTGLRIGVSAIKGLSMSLGIPCAGISTLLGLAYNLLPLPGLILSALDARRNTVYAALFRSSGKNISRCMEDSNLPIQDLIPLLEEYRKEGELVYILGDGAEMTTALLAERAPYLTQAPPSLLNLRASSLCLAARELALSSPQSLLAPEALEPVYLRMVQAERERLERQKTSDEYSS